MPQIPIIMPQLGESIAEATIVNIAVQVGDQVDADQDVIEVETNKAVMSVTTPCPGRVDCILVEAGQSYSVGAILGYLVATEEDAIRHGLDVPAPAAALAEIDGVDGQEAAAAVRPEATQPAAVQPTVRGLPVPAHAAGASYMSPRMKARMNELGLHAADLAGIAGSGAAGRVTIEDFENFLAQLESLTITPASSMRVAVADAMRRSATRPIATAGRPLVLEAMLAHRKQSNPKPGPALYLLRALGIALAENSAPAGRLVGDRIAHPAAIDIGVAVEAEEGVLVPIPPGWPTSSQPTTTSSNWPANVACRRTHRAVPSPPSPISAPSGSPGPRPSRCPNKRSCSAWARGRSCPVGTRKPARLNPSRKRI